jgi:hypothetical protein
LRFASEYAQAGLDLPIYTGPLPAEVRSLLPLRSVDALNFGSALRFALITDRFSAGFKLKSTAYLADNAVVLSFADIREEFEGLPDAALFVRHLERTADIPRHIAAISSLPPQELYERFSAFQQACRERFDWRRTATCLLSTLRELHGAGGRSHGWAQSVESAPSSEGARV